MQNKPRGVMQSPVTPLKDDFSLDLPTFERLLDFHVHAGAPAISWPHHKGESLNLTTDRVAENLGVAAEKVAIINADRIRALQQDRVDLVAVGMTRSKGRAKDIAFSLAYLDSPHMVLVRKDSGITHVAQLAGRKLALVRSASVDAELKAAVPTMEIVFFDGYKASFTAPADGRVAGFLADKMLLLWFAQHSGQAADFTLIADYELPRTAGFALKKNEPRLLDFVNQTLLKLEASGEAAGIYDAWFAPVPRTFRIQSD